MKAVRKWNEEKIQEGIYSVMKKNKTENMPSSKLIYETNNSFALSIAIERNGGFHYWANKLGLKQNKSETRFGNIYEQECLRYLTDHKYNGEAMTTKYPYDIFVDGVKIDVKASNLFKCNHGVFYTFNLEKKYPTCDIFVAYCIENQEQIKKVYVIPSIVLQGKTQLSIGEKTSIYDRYLNAWEIIDDYKNFLMFVKNRGNI